MNLMKDIEKRILVEMEREGYNNIYELVNNKDDINEILGFHWEGEREEYFDEFQEEFFEWYFSNCEYNSMVKNKEDFISFVLEDVVNELIEAE